MLKLLPDPVKVLTAPFEAGMRISTGEDPGKVFQEVAGQGVMAVSGGNQLIDDTQKALQGAVNDTLWDAFKNAL